MTEHTALALWETIVDVLAGYLLAESVLLLALLWRTWRDKIFCRSLGVLLRLVCSPDYRKEVFWGRAETYVAVFVFGATATTVLRKFSPLGYEAWLVGCGALSVSALLLLLACSFARKLTGVALYFLEDGVVRSVWLGVADAELRDPALRKFVENHVPKGDHVAVFRLRDGRKGKLVFFALEGAPLSETLAEVFSIEGISLRDLENLAKAKQAPGAVGRKVGLESAGTAASGKPSP